MITKSKGTIFLEHIQKHLRKNQQVICKICGKTVDQIFEDEMKKAIEEHEQ